MFFSMFPLYFHCKSERLSRRRTLRSDECANMFEEIIMRNSDEFKDRVAVITGGSEGIGRNFVRVLCEVGCKVYFCARNAEHGKVVENAYGPKAHFVQVDLAVPEQINAFAAHVREREGAVDFLVNNAANDDRIKFRDITLEECDRMWKLNIRPCDFAATHRHLEKQVGALPGIA